eukprot:Gregarina_sp_Poly_1__9521@NODE_599_length_7258_cov_119_643026_g462_i0_p1_GENE_NODE_599_length_7258_cov_119_643026_g462_i0NODE_599_length_7258_cov_119_643026_g462_i0_p1_ORF_typecomplete_len920_score152_69HEAT_2/PF13646_6/1e04HEAT_2/PF13646_6/31HEAT_2/PF13646_6/0_0025HEAT/PF02985_22/81HEAT/PF02985_22/32HEAT/PF02985_22/61CLASP_N/PF12348_8/29CLASP_N/PF12348_8/0_22_NODE_599_length_7258_cov_119_643026_g462_i028615620
MEVAAVVDWTAAVVDDGLSSVSSARSDDYEIRTTGGNPILDVQLDTDLKSIIEYVPSTTQTQISGCSECVVGDGEVWTLANQLLALKPLVAQTIVVDRESVGRDPKPSLLNDELAEEPLAAVDTPNVVLPSSGHKRKRTRQIEQRVVDTQAMLMKADLKLTTLCSLISALQHCVGRVTGVPTRSDDGKRQGHFASVVSIDERQGAVAVLEACLDVLCDLLPVLAKLYDESLSVRTSIKRVKRNPQERFNEKGDMIVSSLSPRGQDSTGRVAFDNTPFQVIRCLYHLLMGIAECATSSLLVFADDWEETVRCRAFEALGVIWKPSDFLCPEGVWKVAEFGSSQLAPLKQWTWLHSGFTRMTGAAAMEFPAEQPSYFSPVTSDIAQFTEMRRASAAMQHKILNARIKSKYHVDEAFHFLINVHPDGFSFHSKLKHLVQRALLLEVYQPEPGWLIRGLEDPSDDVRVEATEFLIRSFKHDSTSLQYKDRFNLPLVDLLWDSSDIVRLKAADCLVLLSMQQPFKDGAYKRFSSLLCAKKRHMKRTGMRLLTQCVALNTQALREALRGLLQAAEEVSSETISVHDCVRGALHLVSSNKDSGVVEMIELAKEFAKERLDLLESDHCLQHPQMIVLLMFGFGALQCNASAGLSSLGPSMLKYYPVLQSRYPSFLRLDLVAIPSATLPLVLRAEPSVVKGFRTGKFPGLHTDSSVIRRYVDKGLLSIASALNAETTNCYEGLQLPLPLRSEGSEFFLSFLNDRSSVGDSGFVGDGSSSEPNPAEVGSKEVLQVEGNVQRINCSKCAEFEWRIDCLLVDDYVDRFVLRFECDLTVLKSEKLSLSPLASEDEESLEGEICMDISVTPQGPRLVRLPIEEKHQIFQVKPLGDYEEVNNSVHVVIFDCLKSSYSIPKLCSLFCKIGIGRPC